MSYISLTDSFKKSVVSQLNTRSQRNKGNSGVLPLIAVGATLTSCVDTIIGAGAFIASFMTLGQNKAVREQMVNHLKSVDNLISRLYESIIKTVNPKAQFHHHIGEITSIVNNALNKKIDRCVQGNFFKKHVISRSLIAGRVVIGIATRIMDFIAGIGVFGLLASSVTLGKYKFANELAFSGLQLPAIGTDILMGIIAFLNPEANRELSKSNGRDEDPKAMELTDEEKDEVNNG